MPDPAVSGVPVRVAVDGVDGAGKTVFADELAATLQTMGREVVRVSIDGFHAVEARRHARGRLSPEGFWLDSYDYAAFERHVLAPFAPGGSRIYRSAVHDVDTDAVLDTAEQTAPDECVLVVDGIFLHRDELRAMWDFSLFLDVDFATALARMVHRDGASPDGQDPRNRRYSEGQQLYLAACHPADRASMVIDNNDFSQPVIRRRL
ncbi:hypothetical protein GCM10009838_59330 [Catenulispora subtropica]|uniref:Phosphoribulokinase/uridine kinase domain-containing protein n=1 Tax=Catenulispora subtropica TaxID=450798 RepID=A0ABP5DYJ2_9ACTN